MSLKKNFIKRVAAILLCFIIFAVQLCSSVFAATQTVSYTVGNTTANKGGTVTVPIKLVTSDGKMIDLNGVMFTLTYDSSKLEYVASSVASSLKGLTAFNKSNKVSCAWFDTTSSKVASNTVLLNIGFRVKDDAEGNSAELQFKSENIYKTTVSGGSTTHVPYTCTTPTVNAVVNIGVDGVVQSVINAIDAIGKVENTEECYNKIAAATRLYGKLTVAQKAKVTNYNKLTEAEKTYNQLRVDATQKAIDEEVAKFKTDHADALAVRITEGEEKLSIDKYDILKAAYDRFGTGNGKLSAGAQAELINDYRRLGFYLEMLKDAKAAKDEEDRLEQLKKWEYELCQAYVHGGYEIDPLTGEYLKDGKGNKVWITGLTESDSGWADILTMTKKNVTSIEYTRLNYFVTNWYEGMVGLHPDIETVMNDECDGLAKQILEAYERAKELNALENPELTPAQIAANDFRSKFSYVLGLTEKTATYEDLPQIEMAIAVYEFMTDETKELLTKEYTLLQNLKSVAGSKTPAGGGGDIAGPGESVFDISAEANSLYSAFNQTWSNVFAMKAEDVTAEDYPVLLAMISNYEAICSMNPEVANLLSEQMKAVYAMYDKAAQLNGSASGNATIAGPAVAGWDSNTVLEFLGRDIGVIVWILLALLALSTTIFIVLRIFYHSLKKNKALFAEEVAI